MNYKELLENKDEILDYFIFMANDPDFSRQDIADELGCSIAAVKLWKSNLGLNADAKLYREQKRLYDEGGLTQDILKELLIYNKEDGVFTNKINRVRARRGLVSGSIRNEGYLVVKLFQKTFKLHQLVILYVDGYLPSLQGKLVQHEDQNKRNNRYSNLVVGTDASNSLNKPITKDSTTGVLGVSITQYGTYVVDINRKGYNRFGKTFKTLEEAKVVAEKVYKEYGFHENHGKTADEIKSNR